MLRTLLVLVSLLLGPAMAAGSQWFNIDPGMSTIEDIRERFGPPSRETHAKVEGYDTTQWIYEGSRAYAGMVRITVDFGILTPAGYKPTTVRLLKLEPKQYIFGRETVVQAWGIPDSVGHTEGLTTFFYRDGLFVVFDQEGVSATTMIFSVPQPETPPASAPASPPKR